MSSFTVNNKDYSHKELNKIYDFFSQAQWDVIDQALDCYAQSEKYVGVVKWLNSFGISTIVAAINAFEKDRIYCREKINNYFLTFSHI